METRVKEYKSNGSYQRDASRMAAEGWRVVSVTEKAKPIGCARGCLLGIFSLIWKPKPIVLVTYQRP